MNSICNRCKCFNNGCTGMSEHYTGCVYWEITTNETKNENKNNIKEGDI